MHILHGTWIAETTQFIFWGEDTTTPVAEYQRKGKHRRGEPHPFSLSILHRLNYLDELLPDSNPDGMTLTYWLPGRGPTAQPSPEAQTAGMRSLPSADLALLDWSIDAITLSADQTLRFLLRLPPPDRPHSAFILGADIAYWQGAALLVMEMLIEGHYQPTVSKNGTQYEAGWQSRLAETRLRQVAQSMPPLCRAAVPTTNAAADPVELLTHFLSTMLVANIHERHRALSPLKSLWVRALMSADAVIRDTPARNTKLFQRWRQWAEPQLTVGQSGPFRVCFRLDEPTDESNRWMLAFMLQARDDASVFVDAIQVWNATGRTAHFLNRRFDHPQESFLLALGTASKIFPPIDQALRQSKPLGVVITPEQAYQFLTDAVPKLEHMGFGVLVPNWWKRRGKIKARAKLKGEQNVNGGLLGRDALLEYQWQLSVGNQQMTPDEFEQLVQLRQPFLRLQGQWVAVDAEQINAMLDFLRQHPEGKVNLLGAVELGAAESDMIEVETPSAEGWLNDLLKKLNTPDQASVPAIPASLNATLRPYQQRGFGWLTQMRTLGLGGILADQMGLGKTPQTITLWLHEREQMGVERPALLVAPSSVVGNWRHELAKFAPSLRMVVHQGAARLQDEAFVQAATSADVVLTSYALLHRDLETLQRVQWSSVTLDEAQNIKNPTTKMAQAARAIESDHRLALTGTPIENRLSELWSIMNFLNPGYLGSRERFRERFALPIERYGDNKAASMLKRLTAPFILRRLKTDPKIIDDLPEKFESKVYCTLTTEQATLYEAVVRESLEEIAGAEGAMQRRGNVLRMLTRLKQICNHPAHFLKDGEGEALSVAALAGRSGKLTRLAEMMEEVLSAGDRALIFTQYAEMGKHLQSFLAEYFETNVPFLYGDTPIEKRSDMVAHFQSPRGPSIFVLSIKAGGTGLNLTNANYVFHYDRWYNPAVEDQATDRAFRIGQTRNVQVNKLICLGTLEERIDELIEHKRDLADKIVGDGGEGWLSEMSNDDLRDLVTLRREAIEE
jgi:SNF2 family DNA or RNA helicase